MKEALTEPPLAQRGYRTQGLTCLLGRQGQLCVTNSQAPTHENWLVKCSPQAPAFSLSSQLEIFYL